jgi:hypothetical protein
MTWSKYYSLERAKQLKNEGRELIGKVVLFTVKRDGENVSLSLDGSEPKISSHNNEVADGDIQNRMKATSEYTKATELLQSELTYNKKWILYGELLKSISPTRIEPKRKHLHWVMFDMRDAETGKYADYSYVYQMGYNFRIPVVETIGEFRVESLDHLNAEILNAMKWCARHRREGIVGKCYHDEIFFKEKINLPHRPKLPKAQQGVQLPTMPDEKAWSALKQAYDECQRIGVDWKDKGKAMPIVVKYAQTEAEEHKYSMPKNIYWFYTEYPPKAVMN